MIISLTHPRPTISRISATFSSLRYGSASFMKTFHLKHETDRSWTLLGWRHDDHFEDGGYRTRQSAIEAATAIFERECEDWRAARQDLSSP